MLNLRLENNSSMKWEDPGEHRWDQAPEEINLSEALRKNFRLGCISDIAQEYSTTMSGQVAECDTWNTQEDGSKLWQGGAEDTMTLEDGVPPSKYTGVKAAALE